MANGITGQVFLEDFDTGIATTLGGEVIQIELDGEEADGYALAVAGVEGSDLYNGMVPVFFHDPEDSHQQDILPSIVIARGDPSPDMARWFPGGHEYIAPSPKSDIVPGPDGTMMARTVQKKYWSYPYKIPYDIHLRARRRVQANLLFRHVGRIFWRYGQVFLKDSEGEERGYYAFVEGTANLSELRDIADRIQGFTLSLEVEGELDFEEPITATSAHRGVSVNVRPLR